MCLEVKRKHTDHLLNHSPVKPGINGNFSFYHMVFEVKEFTLVISCLYSTIGIPVRSQIMSGLIDQIHSKAFCEGDHLQHHNF